MLFPFRCPSCQGTLEADASLSGSQAECPQCGKAVAVPQSQVKEGTTLAGFQLERLLGRGGMGEVWLARQVSVDRPVAVKVLPPGFEGNEMAVQRFLREGKLAGRLDHASIATVHEAGEDAGHYYLAMVYVDGESLDRRLRREGTLPEDEALRIAHEVAEALAYAWENFQMLHRDIKPSNIMVDRRQRVFLLDLGLAKTLGQDSAMTLSGTVVGTALYMSPEQAMGESDLSVASDIYSLGATLYHLVTGAPPFESDSALQILNQHVHKPLPPPRERNPKLTAACASLIERMLAKKPENRYSDWRALLADLDLVRAAKAPSPGPAAPPPTPEADPAAKTEVMPNGTRRKPRRVMLGGAAAAVVALLLLGVFVLVRRSRNDSEPAATHSPADASSVLRLYVSADGNDDCSGTAPTPAGSQGEGAFRTLGRAREEIRRRLAEGKLPPQGAIVSVQSGVYELAQPFVLTEADSAPDGARIVYCGSGPDPVRLLAGRRPKACSPVPSDQLARLPRAARAHAVQIDLSALGLMEEDRTRKGIEVFVDGAPLTSARYPNEGTIQVTRVSDQDPHQDRGRSGSRYGEIWFQDGEARRWLGESDLWAHGYWFWDWAEQRHKVAELDPEAGRMRFAPPFHHYGYRKGARFYVYNCLGELDQPGEWHLDTARGVATLWPPASPGKADILVSALPMVIEMQQTRNVTLRGFVLEGATGTALVASSVAGVRVEACTIRSCGGGGVSLSGQDSQVTGCDLRDLGTYGIRLDGGDRTTLTKANLVAENNHIHHYARTVRVYQPAISLSGVGNVARRNLIHDAPHAAIGFSGNDHLIEKNEIHTVCTQSNDAGAIYAGRDWTQRGTILRHNLLHHLKGLGGGGCTGVYLDDQFCGTTIQGNVFVAVPCAVMIRGGRDNLVDNNIFVDCNQAVGLPSLGAGWTKGAIYETLKTRLEKSPYRTELWQRRWPRLRAIMEEEPWLPKGNRITRNIAVGGWSKVTDPARPYVTVENNLTDGDPGFVDAASGDYRLRDDSSAHSLGFAPIPFEEIGVYQNELRASWPPE